MIGIAPLEWPGMNQAFIVSFLVTALMGLAVIPYGKRRPVDAVFTWGEAMLASVYIFGALFLAFGIVPHQWLAHADKDLGWSRDKLLVGPGGVLKAQSNGGWFPMTLQYEVLRDTIVVVIHVVFIAMFMYLAVWWQKRGDVKPKELRSSTYGRPLVRKA